MKTPQIAHLGSLGLIAAGLFAAASLQAQSTIATYDISTATGNPVTPSTASGVTAATLTTTASPGTSLTGTFAKTLWGAGSSLNAAKYITWSVTPTAGNQIDFTGANATFSLFFNGASPANHGADTWDLHASTDGFVGSDISLATGMSLGSTFLAQIPETVPLGTLATQTGTVTFRLYGYNDTTQVAGQSSAGLGNVSGSGFSGTGGNLLVQGTVSAVPEPSSYAAVFGALAFGFVFLTRRLRKA